MSDLPVHDDLVGLTPLIMVQELEQQLPGDGLHVPDGFHVLTAGLDADLMRVQCRVGVQ
jgi:hypothetical protein